MIPARELAGDSSNGPGIGRHRLGFRGAAGRTADDGFKNHGLRQTLIVGKIATGHGWGPSGRRWMNAIDDTLEINRKEVFVKSDK